MTYNEIDYLIKLNENLSCVIADLTMQLNTARADALKEFAERLKECLTDWETDPTDEEIEYTIDNLAKEMVGEGYVGEK